MSEVETKCTNCDVNLTSYDPGVEYGIRDQMGTPFCSIDCQWGYVMRMNEEGKAGDPR